MIEIDCGITRDQFAITPALGLNMVECDQCNAVHGAGIYFHWLPFFVAFTWVWDSFLLEKKEDEETPGNES